MRFNRVEFCGNAALGFGGSISELIKIVEEGDVRAAREQASAEPPGVAGPQAV